MPRRRCFGGGGSDGGTGVTGRSLITKELDRTTLVHGASRSAALRPADAQNAAPLHRHAAALHRRDALAYALGAPGPTGGRRDRRPPPRSHHLHALRAAAIAGPAPRRLAAVLSALARVHARAARSRAGRACACTRGPGAARDG